MDGAIGVTGTLAAKRAAEAPKSEPELAITLLKRAKGHLATAQLPKLRTAMKEPAQV